MLKFKIVIEYTDGNSFGSYEERDEIPYEWTDVDKCQEALDIIIRTADRNDPLYEKFMIQLPLDDGTTHPFQNFWNADYFQGLRSVEIKLVGIGEKVYP